VRVYGRLAVDNPVITRPVFRAVAGEIIQPVAGQFCPAFFNKNFPGFFRIFLTFFRIFLEIFPENSGQSRQGRLPARRVLVPARECTPAEGAWGGGSGRARKGYTQRRLKSPPIACFSGPDGNISAKSDNPISGTVHFSLRLA
jgi:hypothetical protein